jgi:hypothetical protein
MERSMSAEHDRLAPSRIRDSISPASSTREDDRGYGDMRARPHEVGTSGLREVLDFYFYELFSPVRTRLSLRSFQLIITGLYPLWPRELARL